MFGKLSALDVLGPPEVPKIMDPILAIRVLEYWAILLGTFGGPGES